MKECKAFALNDDVMVMIRFSERIIQDYADCKEKAAVSGGLGKKCTGCSLDIPGNEYCLTMFPEIIDELEKRMAGEIK